METTFHDELEVGQRDRISIDISDIREQIEQCRDDVAWSELPLAAKIRVLVKERLAQMEAPTDPEGSDPSTASLSPATNNDD
ncbi:MAG: hypothetical protein AAF329_13960 [Cyanobacteria bacterium P01_A01_bin.17]